MNGFFVIERNNTKNSIVQFLDSSPKTKSIVFLFFHFDGALANGDAPFFLQIGPFTKYMFFKVIRETVPSHPGKLRHVGFKAIVI